MKLIQKLFQAITIILFLMGISIPSISMFTTPDRKISEQEKRELSQIPQLEWGRSFETMVTETQDYLNDQFGYRDELIYWNAYFKAIYLEKSSSRRVIIGKDGWLYFTEFDQIQDRQGLYTYNSEQQGYWRYIFQRRKDWLAERGILYILVIAPDKKTIYPEYYSDKYPIIQTNNTRLDQFLATIHNQTDIHVIDLRIPILNYKNNSGDSTLLYYKTDTHWSPLTGYLAYAYLIQELRTYYPDLPLIPLADLDAYQIPNRVSDLSQFLGLDDAYHESHIHYNVSAQTRCAQTIPYEGTLYTDIGVLTNCDRNPVNLAFFHDSFFVEQRPFFSESFGNTLYFQRISFEPWWWEQDMQDVIDRYQPMIVIEEMVERSIPIPPDWKPIIVDPN